MLLQGYHPGSTFSTWYHALVQIATSVISQQYFQRISESRMSIWSFAWKFYQAVHNCQRTVSEQETVLKINDGPVEGIWSQAIISTANTLARADDVLPTLYLHYAIPAVFTKEVAFPLQCQSLITFCFISQATLVNQHPLIFVPIEAFWRQ